MNADTTATISTTQTRPKWKQRLWRLAIVVASALLAIAWYISPHICTLQSLRQIEGTNIYVMDYYANYDMDEIRREGMDVTDIEGTYIDALFPQLIAPIARQLKSAYVPGDISIVAPPGHHCSSVARRSKSRLQFGRNFDSPNDAILVLRVHKQESVTSVSVIDLAYLNMNRANLHEMSLVARIPLLFSPYYVMDGINQNGLAVSAMSVPSAKAPTRFDAPKVTQSSLMRLLLDYCDSAEDSLDMIASYDISFCENPEHLMLADASGEMAIVEFINGETRIIRSAENWLLSTNHQLWGKSEVQNDQACERYKRGSHAINEVKHKSDDLSFLDAVRCMSVDGWTMWTSIYDLNQQTVTVFYKANPELLYHDTSLSDAITRD